MAPSTPLPPSSDEFAALTTASTDTSVMSPWTSTILVTRPILVHLSGDTPVNVLTPGAVGARSRA